jgi:hypothetical protein
MCIPTMFSEKPELMICSRLCRMASRCMFTRSVKVVRKLEEAGFRLYEEFKTPHYAVTLLTMNFGNPATRESVLNQGYILKLSPFDKK